MFRQVMDKFKARQSINIRIEDNSDVISFEGMGIQNKVGSNKDESRIGKQNAVGE